MTKKYISVFVTYIVVITMNRGIIWHVFATGETRKGFWLEQSARSRDRWEDNMKNDGKETGWEGMERIHLAQDRYKWPAVVNAVMDLRVP